MCLEQSYNQKWPPSFLYTEISARNVLPAHSKPSRVHAQNNSLNIYWQVLKKQKENSVLLTPKAVLLGVRQISTFLYVFFNLHDLF